MECVLTPEATLLLDKLIKTTKCEYITIDTTSTPMIQLCSPDMSQYTIIRLEPIFFSIFKSLNRVVSIPYQKFYKPSMKSLEIQQFLEKTGFDYMLENANYTRRTYNLKGELFDLNFTSVKTIKIDLLCIKNILQRVKEDYIVICIGKCVEIFFGDTVVSINADVNEAPFKFKVEKGLLRNTILNADIFTDHVLAFSDGDSPMNVILRNSEVHFSSFISVEWIESIM